MIITFIVDKLQKAIILIQMSTLILQKILDSKFACNVPVKVLWRNLLPLEVAHALN